MKAPRSSRKFRRLAPTARAKAFWRRTWPTTFHEGVTQGVLDRHRTYGYRHFTIEVETESVGGISRGRVLLEPVGYVAVVHTSRGASPQAILPLRFGGDNGRSFATEAETLMRGYGRRCSPKYRDPKTGAEWSGRGRERELAVDSYAGEVVAVNAVQAPEPTTGLGAVGGVVAGGLLGNQIGGGQGRVLATIAGAVGGGIAGNGIEHAVRKQTTYQVQVRMRDGSYRNFTYPTQPAVQVGERVHVSGDSLTAS